MDMQEIIKQVGSWAKGHTEILTAYVYGSRVSGTHHVNSDLDICVELDPNGMNTEADTIKALFTWTWINNKSKWEEELQSHIPYEIHLELLEEGSKRVGSGSRLRAYQKPEQMGKAD